MATQKKPKIEYAIYFLTINDYSAGFHTGLNYKAVEAANKFHESIPVYKHYPSLAFECECLYPETHKGVSFHITLDEHDELHNITTSDCAVLDDNGHPKLVKRRGQLYPVHQLPDGVGYMEKVRGVNEWRAGCFASSEAVATMISILSTGKQCYLIIDEVKKGRRRKVRALDLQTERPE